MRALVLISGLLAPTLAAANPCEDLARAICPSKAGMGDCVKFVDGELRTPDGKALGGLTRLKACKSALDDASILADYKAGVRGEPRAKRWYAMHVTVDGRKFDGTPWDADDGPDIAACLQIDGKPAGCVPDGNDRKAVSRPECRDALRCELRFEARPGAMVAVEVMDLDDGGSDLIGVCAFTAGGGEAECDGLTLTTEGAGAAAGRVVDRRIVGRWTVDAEATLARDPVEASERAAMAERLKQAWFDFGEDGRLMAAVGEDRWEARYSVAEMKGNELKLAVKGEGGGDEMVVTVEDAGLTVRQAGWVMVLRREP